jgi:hypothetical protein
VTWTTCAVLSHRGSILGRLTTTRTALLAASEGQVEVVRYLLQNGASPLAEDRWGGTRASDAHREGHAEVASLLEKTERGSRELSLARNADSPRPA